MTNEREKKHGLRKEIAAWQTVATVLLGLTATATVIAAVGTAKANDRADAWEQKYHAVRAIEEDAIAAYGNQVLAYDQLVEAWEQDCDARLQQAREYEAAGVYRYVGTCTLTAYCCETKGNPHICGNGDGLTATGLPVAPGMVAVDPDVIPLGSTVIINGVSYLAADTGVSGYHIDIALQTHEDALAFGVQEAEVWVMAEEEEG